LIITSQPTNDHLLVSDNQSHYNINDNNITSDQFHNKTIEKESTNDCSKIFCEKCCCNYCHCCPNFCFQYMKTLESVLSNLSDCGLNVIRVFT
jgi:hypothetical protein